MVRVAINGFGRIGRTIFRLGFGRDDIDFIAVNDLTNPRTLAHLLKYDSIHGKYDRDVKAKDDALIVDGKEIKVFAERDPENLPWHELDIDVVVESTGRFRDKENASKHLKAGAKKVIISAPSKGDGINSVVIGVNEDAIKNGDRIVDNASCTTNCLTPVVKVLNDRFGIKRGFMTTVHAYTSDQNLLDGPHDDLRRARSAAINILPTTTGAATATGKVIPELQGRMDGIAIRVPVADGSLIDLVAELERDVTKDEINKAMKEASEGYLKGILEYSEEPLVSSDVIGSRASCIFDAQSTMVIGGNFIKVLAWYDNEVGYSMRMVELITMM
ncbi:MAG: type I glyceraldehyde-3-phosphate dehydrogenase [Candidatus Altiarchaeales archaeon]|nr:MAG: type I glyceraldehyde-3-phosphate dehydrogenase [Candidatus Altiarchaeales archaeon]